MTTARLTINDNEIQYDCINHADNHDVCLIMSTLSNVLVITAIEAGYTPDLYQCGHVKLTLPLTAVEICRIVYNVMLQVMEQNEGYVRVVWIEQS